MSFLCDLKIFFETKKHKKTIKKGQKKAKNYKKSNKKSPFLRTFQGFGGGIGI